MLIKFIECKFKKSNDYGDMHESNVFPQRFVAQSYDKLNLLRLFLSIYMVA